MSVFSVVLRKPGDLQSSGLSVRVNLFSRLTWFDGGLTSVPWAALSHGHLHMFFFFLIKLIYACVWAGDRKIASGIIDPRKIFSQKIPPGSILPVKSPLEYCPRNIARRRLHP